MVHPLWDSKGNSENTERRLEMILIDFLIFQALVVQKLDNAIQRISVNKTNHAIRWIVIYPVDSVIHFSNNRGLIFHFVCKFGRVEGATREKKL